MKASLYDLQGNKKLDIDLPEFFSTPVREDIVHKYLESEKFLSRQPYGPNPESGRRHSASGKIKHARHKFQGHYGKGISRLPRKTMYRRGTQFFWIGAEVANTRGGRSVHAPLGVYAFRKINQKEKSIAMKSALASTFSLVNKRYSTLNNQTTSSIIESLPLKTKDLFNALKKIYGDVILIAVKRKEVRAGKGRRRGRKYKSNSGILIIKSGKESQNFKGVDVRSVSEVKISDLYPLGRLTLYTQKAMEELKNA